MARGQRGGSQRRHRVWLGWSNTDTVSTGVITAGSSIKIPVISTESTTGELPTAYTIQRTRGSWGGTIPSSGASSQPILGLGWIVLPDSVADAMSFEVSTGIPGPVTDLNEDWFWVSYYHARALNGQISRGDTPDSTPGMIDSKAQRVVKSGE